MVILVDHSVDGATARAVGYTKAIRDAAVSGVTFTEGLEEDWALVAPELDLEVISKEGLRRSLYSIISTGGVRRSGRTTFSQW
jgi:hypothetical protein